MRNSTTHSILNIFQEIWKISKVVGVLIFLMLISGTAEHTPGDFEDRVRASTRSIEFEYVSWTLDALWGKLEQGSLDAARYLNEAQKRQVVEGYLDLTRQIEQNEYQIREILADPTQESPELKTAPLLEAQKELRSRYDKLGPLSETIVQNQLSTTLAELGLTAGGQPIPPVLYHITPLPMVLIVSPRDVIRQDASISLLADLSPEKMYELESKVEETLNVSALVEPVGGVGIYPTMIVRTSSLPFLIEVIGHEWIHNYLTLRPLGMSYFTSGEMRNVNETVASLAGKEIAREVMKRYYPEYLPKEEPVQTPVTTTPSQPPQPPQFDFRKEMHETRVVVDTLLELGKFEDAEKYMEIRRLYFWENGYHLRRLNQAYFAFHGAYADEPGGGAAGEADPVGPAVIALRANSPSLADFLNRISGITSLEELLRIAGK
jgi:hypothetical protein